MKDLESLNFFLFEPCNSLALGGFCFELNWHSAPSSDVESDLKVEYTALLRKTCLIKTRYKV